MTETRCPCILEIGDDHGDNHSTMRCGLLEGHAGDHLEKGNILGNAFEIRWSGDMRGACGRCGGRGEGYNPDERKPLPSGMGMKLAS